MIVLVLTIFEISVKKGYKDIPPTQFLIFPKVKILHIEKPCIFFWGRGEEGTKVLLEKI